MFAIIRTGGKQYRVKEGDRLKVEKIKAETGSSVVFDEVLLVGEGKDVKVGTPLVKDATVEAKVVGHDRGDKVLVFKFKRRKRYRRCRWRFSVSRRSLRMG